jgi:prevent-host-death family protein
MTTVVTWSHALRSIQLRTAKASLSAVVDAAERGEATTITRRGKPAAVVIPVSDARKLYRDTRPSLISLLMAIPHPLEVERDETPMRDIDL